MGVFLQLGDFCTPSQIYLLINDTKPPFAFNSTGKCERGPIYHLLVDICENGYIHSHIFLLIMIHDPPFALTSTWKCEISKIIAYMFIVEKYQIFFYIGDKFLIFFLWNLGNIAQHLIGNILEKSHSRAIFTHILEWWCPRF